MLRPSYHDLPADSACDLSEALDYLAGFERDDLPGRFARGDALVFAAVVRRF